MEKWITTKTELDIDKQEKQSYLFQTRTIKTNGDILDEFEYDADENVIVKKFFKYFEDGGVKEYIEYDPFDELLERHSYFQNEEDEIEKIEFDYVDNGRITKLFTYTDLGNVEKIIIKDEYGEIIGYEIFIFDEEGRVIRELELDAEQNEINRYEKSYSADVDDRLQFESYYEEKELVSKETFVYDAMGNVLKKTEQNFKDKFEVIDIYQYDNQNNMIYNTTRQNGVLVFENKCGYDDENNLISEEIFELDFWQKKITKHEILIHKRLS
ncbi:MAG: hypothetical protein Q4G63_00095 [Bacteroidia bacterium]|nr:hypothetical protein [Bacteroidia bacterium]